MINVGAHTLPLFSQLFLKKEKWFVIMRGKMEVSHFSLSVRKQLYCALSSLREV